LRPQNGSIRRGLTRPLRTRGLSIVPVGGLVQKGAQRFGIEPRAQQKGAELASAADRIVVAGEAVEAAPDKLPRAAFLLGRRGGRVLCESAIDEAFADAELAQLRADLQRTDRFRLELVARENAGESGVVELAFLLEVRDGAINRSLVESPLLEAAAEFGHGTRARLQKARRGAARADEGVGGEDCFARLFVENVAS